MKNQRNLSPSAVHSILGGLARGTRLGFEFDLPRLLCLLETLGRPRDGRAAGRFVKTCMTVARALYELEKFDQAEQIVKSIISISRDFNLTRTLLKATLFLSVLLKRRRACGEAVEMLQEAICIAKSTRQNTLLHHLLKAREDNQALLIHEAAVSQQNVSIRDEDAFPVSILKPVEAYGAKFDRKQYARSLRRECEEETT